MPSIAQRCKVGLTFAASETGQATLACCTSGISSPKRTPTLLTAAPLKLAASEVARSDSA
jgi:hypothetical protein